MFEQKGGVRLKDTSLTGFEPIQQMLNSPNAKLKVLTASSLKGFMLTLDVQPGNSKYLTQTKTDKNFKTEATSFILKYVVITDSGQKLSYYNYFFVGMDVEVLRLKNKKYEYEKAIVTGVSPDAPGVKVVMVDVKYEDGTMDTGVSVGNDKVRGFKKASETDESFYNEAILQQDIWESSVQGNKEAICPPVANFSMFDHQSSIDLLTQQLQSKSNQNNNILNYLLNEVNKSQTYKIGILTMPKIKSITLYDFLDNNYRNVSLIEYMYSSAIARLVRLFVDSTKTFHFDLHGGNVLVMDSGECIIIDFGNAFRFAKNDKEEKDLLSDKCPGINKRLTNDLLNNCHKYSDEMFTRYFYLLPMKDTEKNVILKMEYIESILVQLQTYETTITDYVYGTSYDQMNWVNGVNGSGMVANEIYLNAFKMLGIEVVDARAHPKSYYTDLRKGNPIEKTILTSLPPASLVTPSPSAGPLIANVPKTSNGGEWVCKMVAGAAVCTFVAGKMLGFFGGKSKRNKRKRTRKTKRRR
jgi:hypothetical protein